MNQLNVTWEEQIAQVGISRYCLRQPFSGQRHGQGTVYAKPEGYEKEEKQLYRGSFKNGLFHGHGTLYWPGKDTYRYIGRFKGGVRHGRGIEFDNLGVKIYKGTFRDDKREGRGEEFYERMCVYKGEFSNNVRHGFGVGFYGDGGKYYGRYENGVFSGIGIYVHGDGNGSRYEGVFFNGKCDGVGSSYRKDQNGVVHATHALWQANRVVKEGGSAFAPTVADLPDDSGQNMFTEIMNRRDSLYGDDEVGEAEASADMPVNEAGGQQKASRGSISAAGGWKTFNDYYDGTCFLCYIAKLPVEAHRSAVSKSDLWKVQLGRYLKYA